MNLAAMRTKFKGQMAGLADSMSDADIDVFLNGAYQFTIPNEVDGFITEGEWVITTVADTGEYAYPDNLYSVRNAAPMIDDNSYLSYHTRPQLFWHYYERTGGNSARPTGALFYGTTVQLRPVPEQEYTVRVFTRNYPDALETAGLPNRTHALATVYAAAIEYAEELDLSALLANLVPRYDEQVGALRTRSNNRTRERYPVRSF